MSGEDQLANVNMDSILMSVAVWGIRVKLYDISLVKHGGCSAPLAPDTHNCTLSDRGFSACSRLTGRVGDRGWRWGIGSWRIKCECLNVSGWVGGGVRVVHSDPAATIKIGGVRCLHSSLCKSHQPEPFLFLAAGYIIIRLAGKCGR